MNPTEVSSHTIARKAALAAVYAKIDGNAQHHLGGYYSMAQLRDEGRQATATYRGKTYHGWVMESADFVDYVGFYQLRVPIGQLDSLRFGQWAQEPFGGAESHVRDRPLKDCLDAVIEFKRGIEFPRFSVKAGERWGFVVFRRLAERLINIESGERFDFAGGQCLASDVEVIYIGACGYARTEALGHYPAAMNGQYLIAADFSADDRSPYPVTSSLVQFFPQTSFRPEPMRVIQRVSESGTSFQVETYSKPLGRWVCQKSHSLKHHAMQDAATWYPYPDSTVRPL